MCRRGSGEEAEWIDWQSESCAKFRSICQQPLLYQLSLAIKIYVFSKAYHGISRHEQICLQNGTTIRTKGGGTVFLSKKKRRLTKPGDRNVFSAGTAIVRVFLESRKPESSTFGAIFSFSLVFSLRSLPKRSIICVTLRYIRNYIVC